MRQRRRHFSALRFFYNWFSRVIFSSLVFRIFILETLFAFIFTREMRMNLRDRLSDRKKSWRISPSIPDTFRRARQHIGSELADALRTIASIYTSLSKGLVKLRDPSRSFDYEIKNHAGCSRSCVHVPPESCGSGSQGQKRPPPPGTIFNFVVYKIWYDGVGSSSQRVNLLGTFTYYPQFSRCNDVNVSPEWFLSSAKLIMIIISSMFPIQPRTVWCMLPTSTNSSQACK